MYKKRILNRLLISIIVFCVFLLAATSSWADHWASSVVPPHGEEALTWCGPATVQMIMEGYPAGGCTETQTTIWGTITANKVEAMWDTDPAALRAALLTCPPSGTWAIHHNVNPDVIIHSAAYWMTRNSYPVAVLLGTSSHNTYPSHEEHWAAIQSIKTDLDPTANSTVNLLTVVIVDPAVPYTTTPSTTWISGSDWYSSEFQAVTKVGSSYLNEYIAIIEPPKFKGRALAPLEVLTGKLLPLKDVIRYLLRNLKEEGVYETDAFSIIKKLQPTEPLLVNKDFGGYYLVPFTKDGKDGPADAAALVNAYTGSLKQVKVFSKPIKFLSKTRAIDIALKYLKEKPDEARAELVYQRDQSQNKFSPLWQIVANKKTVGVDRTGKIITRINRVEHSLKIPGPSVQGIAWDGKQLLVVDGETKKLYKLAPSNGRIIQSFNLKLQKPKGLTFDGRFLWLADEQARKIHALDPDNGQIKKTIELNIPKEKGFKSIEDLTWDGKYLWVAYFAGFSSSFNQIDPETGKIIRSVFADGHPRGLASDGKYLWSICYNGNKLPSKIDRREILEKDSEMMASRIFIRDIEVLEPNGLEYSDNNLWYVDKKLNRIFRLRVMQEKK
ncbi:MAG: hypothetical protein PVG39_28480 [Desulfobacteraceae bacterium]